MSDNKQLHDHDEIDLLLPWYVNDTLEPAEHDRVTRHVTSCAECRESVSLLAEIQAAVTRLPGQYGQDTDVSCAAKAKEIFVCISNPEKIDSRDKQ